MPSRAPRPTARPRIEPQMGSLDAPRPASADGLPHFHAGPPARRVPPAAPRGPSRHLRDRHPVRPWLLLGLLLVLLVVLAARHRDWFARLLPTPQLNHLLDQGDRALAQGHLAAARGFYLQAQTLSGENSRVVGGLQAVGQAELARARAALAARDAAAAGKALQQAQALLGGGLELQRLQAQLVRLRARGVEQADLLARAQQAFTAGHYVGDGGAVALYRQLLQQDPGSAVARHGLDQVGTALARQARASLADGDLAMAGRQIEQLARVLPTQADLPDLSAELASRQRAVQDADARLLAQAAKQMAQGHIATPGSRSALSLYRQVLAQDPGNAQAQAGLARVATALIVQAHAQTDAGDFAAAGTLLDQAAQLAPQSTELAFARARLARAQQRAAQPRIAPEQRRRAQQLAQEAAQAAARGDFLTPPGQSAFDLYRRALDLDGGNAAASAGLRQLPVLAARAARQALTAGRLQRAGRLVEACAQLDPGAGEAAALRRQLGAAWLQQADRDLAGGRHAAARAALAQAQRWAPDDPRVQALAQGLAGGG